jgi:Zn-dependent protease
METVLVILILIYSIILHEISHGYVAYKLGDPTAKYEGRLTLNPVSHIDPFGTVLIPFLTFIFSGFIFGWAKPVPYNPNFLKDPKKDSILIAIAGPLTNILIAILFSFFYALSLKLGSSSLFTEVFDYAVRINLVLAFFNLLPFPPLDGSKIMLYFLPIELYAYLETLGLFLVFIFILFYFSSFSVFIENLKNLLLNFWRFG